MRTLLIAVATAALVIATKSTPQAQAPSCDRPCLASILTGYLDALEARTPGRLPVAPNVRVTEDGVATQLGDGLWKRTVKRRPYRMDFIDVPAGVAALHAVLEENGSPILLAVSLTVANRQITGIDTMIVRTQAESMLFAPANLTTPSATMTYVPQPSERMPRDRMVEIAARYPAGLRAGSFVTADVPFAPNAYRFENGVRMAGPGCTFQPPGCENMRTQRIPTLPEVKHRVVAVDEEMGNVLLYLEFGRGSLVGPAYEGKGLVTFEAFKVYGGVIHAAEAIFKALPLSERQL